MGKKLTLKIFSKKDFWEYIGWIIFTVWLGKKGFSVGVKWYESYNAKVKRRTKRDISGKTYLLKEIINI